MTSETDQLLHRRRMRRSLAFWRTLAVIAIVAAAVGIGWTLSGGTLPGRFGDQIARVEIKGPILSSRPLLTMIERLEENDGVKAVVIAIDSPGGSTVGGESLFKALRALGEEKPVVARIDTVGTSAGYMVALAADHIVSWRTSITGSIGVLIQYGQVDQLLEDIGVEIDKVASSELKAEPNPFGPTPPEAVEMLQGVVNDSYEWFVSLVADRRGMAPEAARRLADGRIMTGHQALEAGLVDAIGGETEAIDWLESERGIEADLPVRTWTPRRRDEDGFIGSFADALAERLLAALGVPTWGRPGDGVVPGRFVDGLSSLWQGSSIEEVGNGETVR